MSTALPLPANDPDLIKTIQSDIAELAVVGETDLALLIYLTGTSRLLDDPLILILRGKSSAGNSFPLETISRMFPEGEVIKAMTLTRKALFNMGDLRHKWVVLGERRHRNEVDSGRMPCIRAVNRYVFNPDAVEQALSDRAARSSQDELGKEADGA